MASRRDNDLDRRVSIEETRKRLLQTKFPSHIFVRKRTSHSEMLEYYGVRNDLLSRGSGSQYPNITPQHIQVFTSLDDIHEDYKPLLDLLYGEWNITNKHSEAGNLPHDELRYLCQRDLVGQFASADLYLFVTLQELLDASEQLQWPIPIELIAYIAQEALSALSIFHQNVRIAGVDLRAGSIALDYSGVLRCDEKGQLRPPQAMQFPAIKFLNLGDVRLNLQTTLKKDRKQFSELVALLLENRPQDAHASQSREKIKEWLKNFESTQAEPSENGRPKYRFPQEIPEAIPEWSRALSEQTRDDIFSKVIEIMSEKRNLITQKEWISALNEWTRQQDSKVKATDADADLDDPDL